MDDMELRHFDRYQLIKQLKAPSSMGSTYRAFDPFLERTVIIKVFDEEEIKNSSHSYSPNLQPEPIEISAKRFKKQALAIARLSDPCIVTIYDGWEDEDTIGIVTEFVEGEPLSKYIHNDKFSIDRKLSLCAQVARTLDYMHRKGVVHRDIKPDNIMVTTGLSIVITDFGIALLKESEEKEKISIAGTIAGTVFYMSPQQLNDMAGVVDGRSDLFSLGVILYEVTTGKWPFGKYGSDIFRNITSICMKTPVPPKEVNSRISDELSKVILKSIEKHLDDRYQTGNEMESAIMSCPEFQQGGEDNQHEDLPKNLEIVENKDPSEPKSNEMPPTESEPKKDSQEIQRPCENTFVSPIRKYLTQKVITYSLIIFLAVVLIIGGAMYYSKTVTTLSVQSKPAGAKVFLDKSYIGNTGEKPLKVELSAGNYEIRLEKEGYVDWTEKIKVEENSQKLLKVFAQLVEDQRAHNR
mgnify:CR=1 FL=1